MNNKIKTIWPYFFILAIVLSFFWKFIVKGLIPLPADITVGMYYPWLDYKWGYVVGVPVKNPLISDSISQFYPFKLNVVEQIKAGNIPLWNNYLFTGYPLIANLQAGTFNPTNILFFLFSNVNAWGIQTLLQPLLAIIFTYLFLRSLKISKFASIFGGVIYAFCGFNIIWLELNVHGYATAFFPLMLYSINKYLKTGRILYCVILSLSLSLQIFSGYPQITIYSLFGLALYLLLFSGIKKSSLIVSLFILLGFLLAGIQLLPTTELFINAQRRFEIVSFSQLYLPWKHIISFIAPDYFGNPVTGNYWGVGDYSTVSGYSGIVAVIISGLALFKIKKEKNILFLSILFLFSLALAFPTPLLNFVYKFNFFGLGSSGSSRALFLANLAIAGLAGFGFDIFFNKFDKKYFRALYFPFILLGGYLSGSILSIILINKTTVGVALPVFEKIYGQIIKNLNVGIRNLFFPLIIFFAILFIFLFKHFILERSKYFYNSKWMNSFLSGIIFLLCLAELFRFGWKFTPFSKKELVYPTTPVIDFLMQNDGIFRVEGGDAVPMNMLSPYGIETVSSYDPLYPLRNAEFLSILNGESPANPRGRYGEINKYDSKLFDLSNICFLLAVNKDEIDKPSENGSPGYKFRLDKFSTVFKDKSVSVIKNNQCFDRAFFVREYLIEKNKEKIASILNSNEFEPSKTIILEKKIPYSFYEKNNKGDLIKVKTYRAGYEEYDVQIERPALFVVSESYYPGWRSYVDGKETEIFRSDYLFRSIYVPKGKHQIVFTYEPISFQVGWKISLITFFGLLIILFCAEIAPLNNKK